MPVCNFFLQGRCRYGEKCWNEHPRGGNRGGGGGGGGGYNNYSNRSSGQQQPRSGGFGNRVWVNPSQQKGNYIQPSSFSSHGSDDWGHGGGGGGGGGGRRENVKSSDFSFSSQNRFSALNTPSTFDRGGRGGGGGGRAAGGTVGDEDDDKKLEVIQMDMDVWEKSGQWGFSCYYSFQTLVSGFTDLSPEELRLEYYSTRASGDLQGYMNAINQLLSQWKTRIQELKIMNPATRAALLAELNGAAPQGSSGGFGSTTATGFGASISSFGSKGFGAPAPAQASGFSFSASNSGFGSAATQSSSTGFGNILAAPTQPPSGFSAASSSAPSASSFSFASSTTDKSAPASGFGSASGFSFSSTAGSGFGVGAPATTGSSGPFGQTSGGFGAAAAQPTSGTGSAEGTSDSLFSPESKLTEEELSQFKAKKFTLGQIPLKPPPSNLLVV
ncbi:nucleoporin NUP42 isoform X2 [Oreochromis aureus]|uniref:nucleoporin NUP42 isoform X2 n=1 Tax=Oreochromis aureus TaxID=47969 RepID=UPI0019549652|nr:nucleoporin NUP42 isoform X2 [Oreochromis aureus]